MNKIEKIEGFSNWKNINKINVGYDNCEKYSFEFENNKYMLKIFNESNNLKKKREIDILNKLDNQNLLIPKVIEYGKIDCWYYYILSWVDGETIKSLKSTLDDVSLYKLGEKVGSIMLIIHKKNNYIINLDNKIEKMLQRLKEYEACHFDMENEDKVIKFVRDNINDLKQQPITIIHGDLTEDNIVINNGEVGFIDFGSSDINYSYYDFHQVQMYNRFFSVPFSVGIIDSYLKQTTVNNNFFKCLKIYSAYLSLYKLVWAKKMNIDGLLEEMKDRYLTIYKDYEGFQIDIPLWYNNFDRSQFK